MHRYIARAVVCLALATNIGSLMYGQDTGLINGSVTDQSGAIIPNAAIAITNKDTAAVRTVAANADGIYSAPSLQPGAYEVRAELQGFRTVVRAATVQAGTATTVNLSMQVGASQEVVTVEAASAQINYDSHTVAGVVTRDSIQELPLNGRNMLQLATLEPGITAAPASTAKFNSLFTVYMLGATGTAYITVDGGSIIDSEESAGTAMSFSNEIVQEFQTSTVNFDLGTGISSSGSINIVTRSGGNAFHGSGYFFYRDHNMSAYPNLVRSALAPNPFFVRRNPGGMVSGPVIKDKLFFFGNYEFANQVQAVQVVPDLPSLRGLTNVFSSPYQSKYITVRLDYKLGSNHSLFVRYSHDGNNGYGPPSNGVAEPSYWPITSNWADQIVLGVTSVLTPNIVNDLRLAGFYWNRNANILPASLCQFPCVGSGLPGIASVVGSSSFQFGNNSPQIGILHRYQIADAVTWQKGDHRFRFGGQFYQDNNQMLWGYCTPACEGAVSPEYVASVVANPALRASIFPTLPTTISSTADLNNLPLYGLQASAGAGIGLGPSQNPGPYQGAGAVQNNRPQFFAQDTWKVRPHLTVNYGLQYQFETGLFNSDVPKPAFLAPVYGSNLSPTSANHLEFSPSLGFAWSVNAKTVIRGGGGIYWDPLAFHYRYTDRGAITPLGNGRITVSTNVITNTFPGIVKVGSGGTTTPIAIGAQIPTGTLTNLTLGQFVQLLNSQIPVLLQQFAPTQQTSGPIAVSAIDVAKSGSQIFPQSFPLGRSYQTSIGVQRDLGAGMVLTVDYARKVSVDGIIGDEDLNRYNSFVNGVRSPVIPACAPSNFTPGVECSNGPITIFADGGRAVYNGLLMKLNERLTHHVQGTVSYAFQSLDSDPSVANGINPTAVYNLNNYHQSFGPLLAHQNLNIAGIVQLPWGTQLSVSQSIISRTPFEAFVPGGDLTGTGANATSSAQSMLPGITFNCFNTGCDKTQLAAAVASFNSTYAGTKFPNGNPIPTLVLPPNYNFGDSIFTTNFRLQKTFKYKERYQLQLMGEMFNALNIANLSAYGTTLDTYNASACGALPSGASSTTCAAQTYKFGQPTQRSAQTFGQTGARAVQVGIRLNF